MEANEVRDEVRAWLEVNWDPALSLVAWRSKLLESGWGAPAWPTEYYGRGLPVALVNDVEDQFAAIGAVGAAQSGVRMLAAASLFRFPTD